MTRHLVRALSAVTFILLLGLLACSDSIGPDAGPPEPITELPRELSSLEQSVLGASNQFAFDLGAELLPEAPDDNLFFSPLSASMLLGMLSNGADGTTWDQMRAVLRLGDLSQEEINRGYADLVTLLLELDPSVTVEIGNSVWSQTGFPVLPDFHARVAESFDAEAEEVDFADPATRDRINAWAGEATNGLIEEIFAPGDLSSATVMALLNALYFKANWTTEFDPDETEAADFTRPDGSTVSVDLMRVEAVLSARGTEEAVAVELPYGGGAFTMVVVVPHEGVDVNGIMAGLDDDAWGLITDGLDSGVREVVVRLPRFELEWDAELNDMLIALGMTDAFAPGLADFSRLTPGGGVWLDLVKQKAFVKVDEMGTEAAAVTGGSVFQSGPTEIRADRPFLFAIRERFSGTILFMGIVNDPTA